ncbi:MAG: hypothetical protein NVS9B1_19210 [Candidatus Dormibacteraceae bacterium]
MIARVAFSDPVEPEIAAVRRENFVQRFKPALAGQPGLRGGYWLTDSDGRHISLTLWESTEAMEAGGRAASAAPLLEGFRPDLLPSPRVEIYEVWDHISAPEPRT